MVEDDRGRLRKLDWRELALIQGFPEDALFAAGLIRTTRMVGQAIPIQVGRAILKAIVSDAMQNAECRMQKADLTPDD
jgi:site-specific DNA-cytosine methylase